MLFEIHHINSMGLEYTSFCLGTLNTNKGTNIIPPFLGGYLKLCECQRMCVFALLPLKRDWLTWKLFVCLQPMCVFVNENLATWKLCVLKMVGFLAGGFKYVFYVHPYLKMNPFWRTYCSKGLVQPPTGIWSKYTGVVEDMAGHNHNLKISEGYFFHKFGGISLPIGCKNEKLAAQVGSQSISPLLVSIESGNMEAAKVRMGIKLGIWFRRMFDQIQRVNAIKRNEGFFSELGGKHC